VPVLTATSFTPLKEELKNKHATKTIMNLQSIKMGLDHHQFSCRFSANDTEKAAISKLLINRNES
jgi:hypothetical protein